MSEPRRKRGPKPKGIRTQFTLALPSDHLEFYRAAAAARGMPTGDYIALRLAQAHEFPEPEYISRNRPQEALPISA